MSQFIKQTDDYSEGRSLVIDFDHAVRLPFSGSTCDIYRARWQRREVFVKRLKEEYRYKPLYLDAMDKEFDIGASLQHPSLPRYLEFHRDYIVMDYIDGATLADMIHRRDPWLAKSKNVSRLLEELVDVVDYLHRHNVVHCDIKPDNIMIRSDNKNLVLIDLDKSYTDALNDTSGHPGKYGLTIDEVGKTAIDFRGMAMVAETLISAGFKFGNHKNFVKACCGDEVDCEILRDMIVSSRSESGLKQSYIYVALGLIGCGLIIGLIGYLMKRSDSHQPETAVKVVEEKIVENTPDDSIDAGIMSQQQLSPSVAIDVAPVSREDIHADARKKAEQLDKRILPYFDELQTGLDRLLTLRSDTALTAQQLLDSIRAFGDKADEHIAEAFAILNEMYPGLTDREAWRVMSYSRAYTGYTRRMAAEGKEYRREYERRFAREGTDPQ